MLDMDRDKKNEQAEAELGHAQPQMRPEPKLMLIFEMQVIKVLLR